VVELSQHLMVSGKRFFLRGIRYTDTPLKTLRDAGFNTLWLDSSPSRSLMEEAINQGFWLVPVLPVMASDPKSVTPDALSAEMNPYLESDGVLIWDVGGGRTMEEAPLVARAVQIIKASDPQQHPIAADVWD